MNLNSSCHRHVVKGESLSMLPAFEKLYFCDLGGHFMLFGKLRILMFFVIYQIRYFWYFMFENNESLAKNA